MDHTSSFSQLIASSHRVRIPVIQRDYAQGRDDQREVRDEFLGAIQEALLRPVDDPALPLDLDFVYGSTISGTFQPLDGQQRLTTLFLLHWFLANQDGILADFRERFVEAGKSRFGYQVRPSSEEFIDALSMFDPSPTAGPLSTLIKDQPWYKRSWQFDQTIRSALAVLDAMQAKFANSMGFYQRLIDLKHPAITFHLLDLGQFNLTDELYIKMNARGKPLTPFETFKARFEQHLRTHFSDLHLPICKGIAIDEFFARRMDQQWSDFFWPHRDKAAATFDMAIMNLLRVLILVTRDPGRGERTDADLAILRDDSPNTFNAFNERHWLDGRLVIALLSLLETWSQLDGGLSTQLPADHPFDLTELASKIMTGQLKLTFQEQAMFAGYVQFIAQAESEFAPRALSDWMRVVFNLAANTDYNRPEDLRRSLAGLAAVSSRMGDINRYLADPGADIAGFSGPQITEERLKAHLINLEDGWPERIARAESQEYLKGQIGFLMLFSGLDVHEVRGNHTSLDLSTARQTVDAFEHYRACADQMLHDMRTETARGRTWELALLARGDMRIKADSNYVLPSIREGAGSWKRVLRLDPDNVPQRDIIKHLWDRLDNPLAPQADLDHLIKNEPDIADWRQAIINTPEIFEYCRQRMFRFAWNGTIYPLRKTQMNGRHAELYTFCLHAQLKRQADLKALTLLAYHETSTSDMEPEMGLFATLDDAEHQFWARSTNQNDVYQLRLHEPQSLTEKVASLLLAEGFVKTEGSWAKLVDRKQLRSAVLDLDTAILAYSDAG